MTPTERILAVLDGKQVERLQMFYLGFDAWPTQQVLGKPLISGETILPIPSAARSWIGGDPS